MRVLLVNDDGIDSVGLKALVQAFAKHHCVTVAAPAQEQSGKSHAITVRKPIEIEAYTNFTAPVAAAWKIHGTPVDCVKIYLEAMLQGGEKPDLIVSGINRGANLGTDVIYSGTVGAAMEGYMHQIPSIAVSLDIHSSLSYDGAAEYLLHQVPLFMERHGYPYLLNVNFPPELRDNKPTFVYTTLGNRDYLNAFQRIERGRRIFYYMEGEIFDGPNDEMTDIYAVNLGYITVTPLQSDLTDTASLNDVSATIKRLSS